MRFLAHFTGFILEKLQNLTDVKARLLSFFIKGRL